MGLATRKQKQRIPADPRNLSWADDASRFGLSYLSKFGWDASQGLGSSGDGMKTHLKVQQKLDIMGIGAQRQRDSDGIAWKQNKEFEALLKRLNQSAEWGEEAGGVNAEGGGLSARETALGEAFVRAQEEAEEGLASKLPETTSKRKLEDNSDASEDARKRRRKEKKEEKKKPRKSSPDSAGPVVDPTSGHLPGLSSSKPDSGPIPKSRPMAHRARIRAAKRIAGKSASAIAEILGIAPPSSVSSSTPIPAPTLPPSSTQPLFSLGDITTSTKSVADYFKEKLAARSSPSSSPASSTTPSGFATPGLGATGPVLGYSQEDVIELPRGGVSSRATAVPPTARVSEASSSSSMGSDTNTNGGTVLTEKRRRKTECKGEKRRRRTAEGSNSASASVAEQVEGEVVEKAQKTSKRKQKKRKRKEQALADQPSDSDGGATEKSHDHDAPSEPKKKSKRGHKKKHSF